MHREDKSVTQLKLRPLTRMIDPPDRSYGSAEPERLAVGLLASSGEAYSTWKSRSVVLLSNAFPSANSNATRRRSDMTISSSLDVLESVLPPVDGISVRVIAPITQHQPTPAVPASLSCLLHLHQCARRVRLTAVGDARQHLYYPSP